VKQRKIPLRRCTGCLEMKNKKELIRVVRTEDDPVFSLDLPERNRGEVLIYVPAAIV